MASKTASVSMDFICQQKSVWDVVSSPSFYHKWHCLSVSMCAAAITRPAAGFSLGSKFKIGENDVTGVVTAFEPMSRFAVSTGSRQEDILITPMEFGCRVTLRVSGLNISADKQQAYIEETLTVLKDTVYSNMQLAQPETKKRIMPRPKLRRINAIVSGLLQGYRSPIETKNTPILDSVELSSIADHSDGDVIVHLRAGLISLMCAVILFSTLSFTYRFERIDIVPSSGMSLTESVDVNKENASRIYIGQYQNSLELMLNCRGMRLTTTDFYYISTARGENGESLVQLIVSYDAYGKVRSVRFVDNTLSKTRLRIPITEIQTKVSPNMTPLEIEHVVGYPLSAFTKDISGVLTVYFGVVEGYDVMKEPETTNALFMPGISAEIVVTTDRSSTNVTDVQYCDYYDPENPLFVREMSPRLRKQYFTYFDSYKADRNAYERGLLFYGLYISEAETILNVETSGYGLTENGMISHFLLRSRVVSEAGSRYQYSLEYGDDDIIRKATMINHYLRQRSDMLLPIEEYKLDLGMSLYDVYAELGILPTCVSQENPYLKVCYGQGKDTGDNLGYVFDIIFVFDIPTNQLVEILFDSQI